VEKSGPIVVAAISLLVSGLTVDILGTFCGVFTVQCIKLAGSTWGASANTLRSSALALCYSAAEYWSCCARTSQVDGGESRQT